MDVSVESTGTLSRKMRVEIPSDKVEGEVRSRLERIGRRAKLKGFRPGKVPLKVVRQQYGAGVRQEVVRDLLRSSWSDAVAEEELEPAGGPTIDEINADPGANLEYTAVFDVYPDIELQNTEHLTATRPDVEIRPEDVDEVLERLREQNAEFEPVDRPAVEGDRITVDFHGTKDGKAFPGGHGENVDVVLGEGRMIGDFETGVEGMSAGEERDIGVTFPDDYPVEDLAGGEAQFHVKAQTVAERRLPAIDDALADRLGVADVDALRTRVEENMRRELDDTLRSTLKNRLMDQLFERNPIELPKALIDNDIQRAREDMLKRMGVDDPEKAPDMPDDLFEDQAKKRVALGLLVGELIKREDIKAAPERVQAKLEAVTTSYEEPDKMIRAYRANEDAMRQVEAMVLEDQVTDWLAERADITNEPKSFRSVMGMDEDTANKEPS
jgi:trigger factor